METKTKILYVSQLCSPRLMEYFFSISMGKLSQEAQKFHRLLAEGLAMHDQACAVKTLSVPPVTSGNSKRRLWNIASEVHGNVNYNYVPIINLPVLRNIVIFIHTFFRVLAWHQFRARKDKIIICDALVLSAASATLLAGKITKAKLVVIVTDLPNLMILGAQSKPTLKQRLFNEMVTYMLPNFDGYILLTEHMNELVNWRRKPHLIMEGLVDSKMSAVSNELGNKAPERIVMYAGGIFEIYGLKKLIEAFIRLNAENLQLHIYGSGEMEKYMPFYMNMDNRIIYHGVVPNQVVVKREIEATLLVNPRSSKEEFTKYSFPSKNMEYMVSGTPLVTTPLPGMPDDYKAYVYLFNDESVDGFYFTLKSVLDKSRIELHEFGHVAKQFVLDNKSNEKQAGRIIDFFKTL